MSDDLLHGFGRIAAPDARDRRYPLRALIRTQPLRAWRYMRTGPVLDQGASGTCVGHAWRQWLMSALIMTRPGEGPDELAIYEEACRRDPWPENDGGDLLFGTSVRAAVQYLQQAGYVGEYRWTWSADDMLDWLLLGKGVLVLGTDWTDGMFTPDRHGVIRPTGPVVGGHAYVVSGANRTAGLFRITNSWGRAWGELGRAWISGEDIQHLLDTGGECCTATQLRVPR